MLFSVKKQKCAFFSFCIALLFSCALSADTVAIIGGVSSGSGYAALVSSSGTVTSLSIATSNPIISSSINSSGTAIIGGSNAFSAYAALVSPSGTVTPLTGLPGGSGNIASASINDSGNSIIGGNNGSAAYGALVSSSGTVTALSGLPGSGIINDVSINNLNSSIIGGESGSSAYAALVSSSGTVTALAGLPTGTISSVSINDSGNSIIGGSTLSSAAYGALVSSSGTVTALSGLPASGSIRGTSINESGDSLIGGTNGSAAYGALVSSSGTVTALSGLPGSGQIFSASINDSGDGVIGGTNGSAAYAALVSSSGTVTALSGLPSSGVINDVSISSLGISLIGGQDTGGSQPAYAALVSPSGVVTALSDLPTTGLIQTVSIATFVPITPSSITETIVPKTFGSGNSYANAIFAFASQILPNHFSSNRFSGQTQKNSQEISLLASAEDDLLWTCPKQPSPNFSIWIDGFGYYNRQKSSPFPRVNSTVAGVLGGFDYLGLRNMTLGGGIAYAYSSSDLQENRGDSKTNQWFSTFYSSWRKHHWCINAAIWGGFYNTHNTRNSIANIVSKASFNGWFFLPHLEICRDFTIKSMEDYQVFFEPFVMLDWVSNWQESIHEKGASGFNLIIGSRYTSMLRSEAGLRFLQDLRLSWGQIVFQEKISYVNLAPFQTGSSSTIFVGSASSFAIEMFSNSLQNLAAAQLNIQFLPCNTSYLYGSLNYQGEFGSRFQSHLGSIEIGKKF